VRRVLFSWLGLDELGPSRASAAAPLSQTLIAAADRFDEIVLLNNHDESSAHEFVERFNANRLVTLVRAPLNSPVDYADIHDRAVEAVERIRSSYSGPMELCFFLSSGTPPMGSVWLLLGKGRYQAKLLAWSKHNKRLEEVDVPFEVSAEFIPTLLRRTDAALRESSLERAPPNAAFTSIVFRCQPMRDLIEKAERVALHDVPVLLEGESGTGKEILARAIHNAIPRRNRPFIAVNCGAIPEHLAESELFGHVKGAFTGAVEARQGHFREAHGGTLFLDEIGELPLRIQVALLRPLQEGQVLPVGASRAVPVNVRVIAATHRNLVKSVAAGTFREDLFYRLAVAVLKVPALREREGDITLLIDYLLAHVNDTSSRAGFAARSLSPAAKNRLLQHSWPGNVRELANTIRRAVVWSKRTTLQASDIDEAMLEMQSNARETDVLPRPIGPGFSLDSLLSEVEAAYIGRALELTNGKKREAARLLGLKSHQVLSNRMKRSRMR
jgi:transcriptional regulator with PAS, ATPase and Fis domain